MVISWGAVAFLFVVGLVSYQSIVKALEGHAAERTTAKVIALHSEAVENHNKIQNNLVESRRWTINSKIYQHSSSL